VSSRSTIAAADEIAGALSSRYRAALFDFDGTLTPSLPLWIKAYHIALRRFGMALTDEQVIRTCLYRDWEPVAADLAIGTGEQLRIEMEIALREAFVEATLFPMALELIAHCREHGMQTALVTSSLRSVIVGTLPRLGLHDQFDFVICGDDVANYKPHPEPILKTLQALGRTPDEAIMIGDARVDVLAGKAAGTATALYLPLGEGHHPFHTPETLRATDPDHIFADHAELPAVLGLPGLRLP
jgi:pyrophosphatase PpaX